MQTITNLKTMPYAQAHIVRDNGGATLISYVTPVATLDNQGWLTVYGLYSMTTRKHIGAFMKEYAPAPFDNYQTAKAAYEGGYRINLYTAEIRELGE